MRFAILVQESKKEMARLCGIGLLLRDNDDYLEVGVCTVG